MSADERLRKLVCKIENCLECYEEFKDHPKEDRIRIRQWYNEGPWFFPPYKGVKGFFGTGEVVFVCERPSTGTFPSKADKLFYDLLKEHKFENAHITDLIKCRSKVNKKAGKRLEDYADKCFDHFLEELKILKPNLIVAVGENVYDYLLKTKNKRFESYKDRLYREPMLHYSHVNRYGREEELKKQFKLINQRMHSERMTL